MEQFVTIELFEQKYKFSTDADVKEAQRIADQLVEEVTRVEGEQIGKTLDMPKRTILILAALNIVNRNYELKSSHEDLMKTISQRSTKIIRLLDTNLS